MARARKEVDITKFLHVRKLVDDKIITKTDATRALGVAYGTYARWDAEYKGLSLDDVREKG